MSFLEERSLEFRDYMVEYHGWATIRVDTTEENAAALAESVTALKNRIEQIAAEQPIIGIRYVNGIPMIWTSGACNHKSQTVIDVLELFASIARIARGSYGILYVWDDEDKAGNANAFVVWRLSRGNVVQLNDPFLSPCVPIIEDP